VTLVAAALPDAHADRSGGGRSDRVRVLPLSVRVKHPTDVYAKPGARKRFVGTLARGTRMPILRTARAGRCKGRRWYQVARGAWMCARNGRPSWRFPQGRARPVLRAGRLVPRRVYFARRDGVPIYLSREDAAAGRHDRLVERGFSFSIRYWLRIDGKRFISTRRHEIVPRKDLWRYRPSRYVGRALPAVPPLPIGCAIGYKSTPVRRGPSRRARRVDRLPHHRWVQIHDIRRRGKRRYYRIERNRWVRARAIRRIHFSAPPADVGPRERWVEILLRHQTLVAYEGPRPVYATLVSTGRWNHKTPTGIFRARTKVAMSTMTNQEGAGELYRVDDVPWIFFFHKGYAVHGTYWHDRFGIPKSHGCINLSPRDARWLFSWAPPRLRPGWSALQTSPRHPGLLIRIRRTTRHEVSYRGPDDQRPGFLGGLSQPPPRLMAGPPPKGRFAPTR
jgi:hypothetical protein